MSLYFDSETGLLLYSEENLFNYNDPAHWYNHTITRTFSDITEKSEQTDDQSDDWIIFIIITATVIGITSVGIFVAVRKFGLNPSKKQNLKHNPKRNET